jgi:type IV pilus secretin PilQ/predicted competence protein
MRAKMAWPVLALALAAAAVRLAPVARAQEPATTALTEIRQERADRSTRLVVDSTGPLAYTHYSPDPLTLVVDVPEVDASRLPSKLDIGSREVESVRVTAMARADGRSLARIEVRLASLVPYQIYTKDKALNLVFERTPEAASAAPAPAAKAEPPRAEPAAVDTARAEPAEAAGEAARWRPLKSEPAVTAENVEPAPVDEPAEAEAAPATGGRRASRILSVSHAQEKGQLAVTIHGDGRLRYQDFFLGNPDRLVVDFSEVTSRAALRAVDVNRDPVRKIRLAQFSTGSPKIARLVLDLSSRMPYRIVEASDGVKIVFGEGRSPAPAPLASLRTAPLDAPPAAMAASAPGAPPASLKPASLVQNDLPQFPVPALPDPAPPAAMAPDPQEGIQPRPPVAGEKIYTGHPISLDFKDGDLQDIFRLFADISGMNIVVNPGVSGKVTLKLNEVPWDQALDLILKANGLGYTVEGNVIRIARLADLQKEQQDQRKLEEEKQLAGDLGTLTQRISYAKAAELSDVVKRAGALSARGSINVDLRTNTMIVKDLPRFLDRVRELIAELDRPTPQVEIEARIVVTSRNFTRDLGIQWGFNQIQAALYGNQTRQGFPNAVVINGSGVPGGGITNNQGGLSDLAGIGQGNRGYAVNLPAASFNSALGISLGNILGNFNLDAAITALERQGRGRLLSTPKVTTQNNQQAEIKQGVQIPIQTTANNTVTVQFKDAVLTLRVTPQITEAGTVILSLEVENNSPDFANRVNGIPPINTQSAKTQVLVRDGATAVIGGIYQSNEQTVQERTPVLGSLPIVGLLFRNRSVTSTNNELLLFITPRIIKG